MCRGLYRLNSTVLNCRLNALNCISSRRSAGIPADLRLEMEQFINCSTHEVQRQKNSCHRKYCGSVVEACPVSGRTKILATTIDNQLDVSGQIRRYPTRQRLMLGVLGTSSVLMSLEFDRIERRTASDWRRQ